MPDTLGDHPALCWICGRPASPKNELCTIHANGAGRVTPTERARFDVLITSFNGFAQRRIVAAAMFAEAWENSTRQSPGTETDAH